MVSVRTSIVPPGPTLPPAHAEYISRCQDIPGHSLNSRPAVSLADSLAGDAEPKKQVEALPLDRHEFHGDWNYTMRPAGYDTP